MIPDEPSFAEPWQAQAFAMTVALNERGLFAWPEWTARFAPRLRQAEDGGDPQAYWNAWIDTLEALLIERQAFTAEALHAREHAWEEAAAATPHGQPIELARPSEVPPAG